MSGFHQPSLSEVQLFASDQFITEAMATDIGRIVIDAAETDQVVRKARASETIPLGAIALISPAEAPHYATTDVILQGVKPQPETALARSLRLRQMTNGFPSSEHVSWGELVQEEQRYRRISFRLATAPKESEIAQHLYRVAAIAPDNPGNDEAIGNLFGLASSVLSLVPTVRPVANLIDAMGNNLGKARQAYDLQTIGRHRPVILEKR